jgi:hypothetical protein
LGFPGTLLGDHLLGITAEDNTQMDHIGRGRSIIGDDHSLTQMGNVEKLGGKFQGQFLYSPRIFILNKIS